MAISESEILQQLEALISDLSHIVSYKWLSRKFSVSSNTAKRLLHEFVDRHGAGVEVLYVLSGWTHDEPPSYSVRLVKSSELEGAKSSFVEGFSAHVYSVQASVPRDPAQVWSHDFVQAEELYNEPLEAVNCLRDNRFSGVTCSLVTRDTKAKGLFHVPLPRNEQVTPSKVPEKPVEPVKVPAEKNDANTKSPSSRATSNAKAKPAHVVSLANMWGRSSSNTSPPKPASISEKAAGPENAGAGQEERDAGASSDDELTNFVRLRRAGRKRRVVLDDENSEDDEEQKVDEEHEAVSEDAVKELPDQSPVDVSEAKPGDAETKKKRKLIRTRIDERGREVTEVVWDKEEGDKVEPAPVEAPAEAAVPPTTKVQAQPQAQAQAPPAKVEAPPPKQPASNFKVANKPAGKPGKGAKPGPQQGSITSFFKKK